MPERRKESSEGAFEDIKPSKFCFVLLMYFGMAVSRAQAQVSYAMSANATPEPELVILQANTGYSFDTRDHVCDVYKVVRQTGSTICMWSGFAADAHCML